MSDENNLMDIVRQTAFNVAGVSEQMGLIANKVTKIETDYLSLNEREDEHHEEFIKYTQLQKTRERVEADEVNEYDTAINNRVADILCDKGRMDLFGKFKSKCWIDSKKHSFMRGKSGVDTLRIHHAEVIEFIGTWYPHGYGVDGYIQHLKELEERNAKT